MITRVMHIGGKSVSRFINTESGLVQKAVLFRKKLENVFASIESQNCRPGFVNYDYLKVLKLFLVACRYRWHGWKWTET